MAHSIQHQTRKIVSLLEDGQKRKVFSGAAAAIQRRESAPVTMLSGRSAEDWGEPLGSDTLFDIASLTKLFTAAAALIRIDQGRLDLDSRLCTLNEALEGRQRGQATLAELLAHEAGYPAWLPLFESVETESRGTAKARRTIIDAAVTAPEDADSSHGCAVYSDLGFITLTHILETLEARRLDQIVEQHLITPLELSSVHYRPIGEKSPVRRIAATENCPWRGRYLVGEVHDENTWSMGGISGHAGLFATAEDVAAFGMHWLSAIDGTGFISQDLARLAIQKRPGGRGLGFDTVSEEGSTAGDLLSRDAVGHLGHTGCSLWIDPDRHMSIALLTNHVHFGYDKPKIRAFRRAFHDAVVECLG